MKIILTTVTIIGLASCSPQTETRAHMDTTGNRMGDSIRKSVDSILALPGQELAGTGSPITSVASSFTPVTAVK